MEWDCWLDTITDSGEPPRFGRSEAGLANSASYILRWPQRRAQQGQVFELAGFQILAVFLSLVGSFCVVLI